MGYTPPPPLRKHPHDPPATTRFKSDSMGKSSPSILSEFFFAKPQRYPGKARALKPYYLRIHAARLYASSGAYFGIAWLASGWLSWVFTAVGAISLVMALGSVALARDRERWDLIEAKQAEMNKAPESYAVDYNLIESVSGEPFVEVYTTDYREIGSSYVGNIDVGGSFDTRIVGGKFDGTHWLTDSLGGAAWVHKLVVGALRAEQDPREWEAPTRDPQDTVGEARIARERQDTALKNANAVSPFILGESRLDEHGTKLVAYESGVNPVRKMGGKNA